MTRKEALKIFGFNEDYEPSQQEISKTYRQLAAKFHPDKNPTEQDAIDFCISIGSSPNSLNPTDIIRLINESNAILTYKTKPSTPLTPSDHITQPNTTKAIVEIVAGMLFRILLSDRINFFIAIAQIPLSNTSIPTLPSNLILRSITQKLSVLCIATLYDKYCTKKDAIYTPEVPRMIATHLFLESSYIFSATCFFVKYQLTKYNWISPHLSWDQNIVNLARNCYRLNKTPEVCLNYDEKPIESITKPINKFISDHPIASKALATVCASFIGLVLYKQLSNPHISELASFSEAAMDVYSAARDVFHRVSQSVSV